MVDSQVSSQTGNRTGKQWTSSQEDRPVSINPADTNQKLYNICSMLDQRYQMLQSILCLWRRQADMPAGTKAGSQASMHRGKSAVMQICSHADRLQSSNTKQ